MKRLALVAAVLAAATLSACSSAPEVSATSDGAGHAVVSPNHDPKAHSVIDQFQSVGDRVFFDLDKYTLRPDARATLDRQVAFLKANAGFAITIEGHADERGTREYNLALGEQRASAVAHYFVAMGLSANRIHTVSFGKERPAVVGSTEAAWAQNRRAVTVLVGQ